MSIDCPKASITKYKKYKLIVTCIKQINIAFYNIIINVFELQLFEHIYKSHGVLVWSSSGYKFACKNRTRQHGQGGKWTTWTTKSGWFYNN